MAVGHCSLFWWNWNYSGQCIPPVVAVRHLRSETPKSDQILSYPIQFPPHNSSLEPQPLLPSRKTSAVLGSLAFSGCRCPAPVGSQASQPLLRWQVATPSMSFQKKMPWGYSIHPTWPKMEHFSVVKRHRTGPHGSPFVGEPCIYGASTNQLMVWLKICPSSFRWEQAANVCGHRDPIRTP